MVCISVSDRSSSLFERKRKGQDRQRAWIEQGKGAGKGKENGNGKRKREREKTEHTVIELLLGKVQLQTKI